MSDAAPPPGTIAWCRDAGVADAVAALFVAHADPTYISHSELQIGRAIDGGTWAADLGERVRRLAVRSAGLENGPVDGIRLATLSSGGRLAGFAFVAFLHGPAAPYAVLEDLLVAPDARGQGDGARFLDWIRGECRARGMRRLYLESGAGNHRAHAFFERQGLRQTSVVMMQDL